jgi:hypothetical protein
LHAPCALTKYFVVTVGVTTTLAPIPTEYDPQEYQYHFQYSVLPRLPPDKFRVADEPLQIIAGEAEAELAGVEFEQTVIVTLAQVVVLQVPSALTKYILSVVAVIIIGFPLLI